MEKRLDKIEQKIDNIQATVVTIDKTLSQQHVSIKEHMKRSDLLEKLVFIAYSAIGGLALALIAMHK